MKHLTDNQITDFWLIGPTDKESYLRILLHLNECGVCRDRAWDSFEGFKKQREAVTSSFEKLIGAIDGAVAKSHEATSSPLAGLFAFPKDVIDEDALGKLKSSMALGNIVRKLATIPETTTLTSQVLFGDDAFDKIDHFAKCEKCYARLKELHELTQNALNNPPPNHLAKPEIAKSITRLNAWLANQLTKIQILKDKQGESEDASSPATECNPRAFSA